MTNIQTERHLGSPPRPLAATVGMPLSIIIQTIERHLLIN